MKTNRQSLRSSVRLGRLAMLAAAAFSIAPLGLLAADDITLDKFDTTAAWQKWWGNAGQTYEWDGTVDADANPASGSLKVTINFDLATHAGENQFAAYGAFPQVDGSQYTNLVFDLRWDPSSPKRPSGDFGWLEPGFRNADWSQNWLPGMAVPSSGGWLHIVLPINPNAAKIDTVNGVLLKMWSGGAGDGFTGTATFWVDNIKLIARPTTTVDPPPTMSVEKASPGLKLFASAAGAQYQRQSIRTASSAFTWVELFDAVTYSITIADFPDSAHSGFQAHMFLVPGGPAANQSAPDWTEPNLILLQIVNNADGSAYAQFMYKTNQPNGNSMLFGAGTLANIGSPSVRGTWSLTFNPFADIVLTTPSGTKTNFTIPPENLPLFAGSLYAYFGAQPNQLNNIGQSARISRVQITGVQTPIDDNFSGPALADTWQVVAESPVGVVQVPSDALVWLNWTLPDRDFALQVSSDLSSLWSDLALPGVQIGDYKRRLILPSDLPPGVSGNNFFQLKKQLPLP